MLKHLGGLTDSFFHQASLNFDPALPGVYNPPPLRLLGILLMIQGGRMFFRVQVAVGSGAEANPRAYFSKRSFTSLCHPLFSHVNS
jgi:hypothetical protein